MIDRRRFLASWAALLVSPRPRSDEPAIQTVAGPIRPDQLGRTLPHEHVLVDFIGADRVSPDRYEADAVYATVRPFLAEARDAGLRTLVDCTPAYIGRDPALLARLSRETGVQILCPTGYYNAAGGKFLPAHARAETADQLAARWIAEARDGIDRTGIRPGFVKIGVDVGPLPPDSVKVVRAAARTHRAAGLTIMAHTGDAAAAREQVDLLAEEGVHPSAWIWAHAQNATLDDWLALARRGAWVELDHGGPDTLHAIAAHAVAFRDAGLLDRLLLSHDAGWYHVGEPGGGTFRPFTPLLADFPARARAAGLTDADLDRLFVANPRAAFTPRPRLA
jgi:phosphotriesterase-related protein